MDTIYAVCPECSHVEPRPAHAVEDWQACEVCGEESPLPYEDHSEAIAASDDAYGLRSTWT